MTRPENKFERLRIGHKKALKAFKTYYSDRGTPESMPGHFGVLRKTRKLCSSPLCCGNPRRERARNNPTLRERKLTQPCPDIDNLPPSEFDELLYWELGNN